MASLVTYSFRPYHGPGVDSAPSENEYQEHFLGVKAAGAWSWQPHQLHVPNVMEIWEPKPPETLWATPGLLRDSFIRHREYWWWGVGPYVPPALTLQNSVFFAQCIYLFSTILTLIIDYSPNSIQLVHSPYGDSVYCQVRTDFYVLFESVSGLEVFDNFPLFRHMLHCCATSSH